ncbi:FecR family protein [Pedobacter sp. UBA5917]|uniref:FecR family protein n=1 Tax=Pedobacter sp. UBA5917 TaxID=1947061 RepID=UPI0025D78C59|nr:FecR domain-containing protein [Pedobacter sp. UBA5917]
MEKDKSKQIEAIESKLDAYFDEAQKDSFRLDIKTTFEHDKVYSNILDSIDNKTRNRKYLKLFRVAASVLLFGAVCFLIYRQQDNGPATGQPLAMLEKKVGRGKIVSLTLVDGTIVYLNADSRLRYPEKFVGNTREVSLSGEAFFKVAHDKSKPFIIHTDKLNTQVLGTSFNISAYSNENISVTVVTGKVSVYQKKHDKALRQTRILLPNHQVLFDKRSDSISNPYPVDVNELVAWHERKILYKSRRLAEVAAEIERGYDVKIQIPRHLKDCRITAELNNPSLDKLLKVLSRLIDGRYEYKNGIYILSGKSC